MLLHAVQCLWWEQLEVSSMRKSTGNNSFVTTALFAGLCCLIHFHYLTCCSCAYTWWCIFIASINSVTLLSTSLLGYFEIVPRRENYYKNLYRQFFSTRQFYSNSHLGYSAMYEQLADIVFVYTKWRKSKGQECHSFIWLSAGIG